jgi:hypothetical protein
MHLGKSLGAIRRAAGKKAVNVLKTYEMDGKKSRLAGAMAQQGDLC